MDQIFYVWKLVSREPLANDTHCNKIAFDYNNISSLNVDGIYQVGHFDVGYDFTKWFDCPQWYSIVLFQYPPCNSLQSYEQFGCSGSLSAILQPYCLGNFHKTNLKYLTAIFVMV